MILRPRNSTYANISRRCAHPAPFPKSKRGYQRRVERRYIIQSKRHNINEEQTNAVI